MTALPAIRNPQSNVANAPRWLTVEEAARALGKTTRCIRQWCAAGRIGCRLEDGRWLIDPASRTELRIAAGTPLAPALAGTSELAGLPVEHRRRVYEKLQLVREYQESLAERPQDCPILQWQRRWVEAWNLQNPQKRLAPRTLYKMIALYERKGLAALVDRRHANGSASEMQPELQEFLLGAYLSENRPSVPYIYELAQAAAGRNGWQLPSLRSVQGWIARRDRKLMAAGREPKRFRDRCTPHITRDWDLVAAMECVVGDHHQFDILWPRLTWSAGKRELLWQWNRPWLSAWLDARTWFLYAHAIAFDSPDGNRVMGSFLQGVLEHGAPGHAYIDNGKDYRMYRFAGGRRKPAEAAEKVLAERSIRPVLEMLGVGVTFATPYNAKAKVIEPFFGVMAGRFSKSYPTYCGNRPDRRPERLRELTGKSGAFAERFFGPAVIEQLKRFREPAEQGRRDELCLSALKADFARWVHGYYHASESPSKAAHGLSPARAFVELRKPDFLASRPAEQDLALLLMPSEPVTCQANGVWVRHFGRYYMAPELERRRCNGDRVVYRYNPDDPSRIFVFDADRDAFLAVAHPTAGQGVHPLAATAGPAAVAALSDAIAFQRHAAKTVRSGAGFARRQAAGTLADILRIGAESAGRLQEAPDLPAPAVVPLPALAQAAEAAARPAEPPARPVIEFDREPTDEDGDTFNVQRSTFNVQRSKTTVWEAMK